MSKPKSRFHRAGATPVSQFVQLPPRQDAVVRSGSTIDAEAWRGAFLAALRFEAAPEQLHAQLVSGRDSQAWKLLRDHEGVRFRTFDHFCSTPRPYGLGSDPAAIQRLLQGLIGERQTALATSPPSNQGRRDLGPTSPQIGEKSKTTMDRLRAVQERAPAPVRKLFEARVLSLGEAASLSVRKPSASQKATIDAICAVADRIVAEVEQEPTVARLEHAKAQVLPLFPPPPSPVIRLQHQFEKLAATDKEEFCRWLDSRQRPALGKQA